LRRGREGRRRESSPIRDASISIRLPRHVGEDDREGAGAVLPPLLVDRTVPVEEERGTVTGRGRECGRGEGKWGREEGELTR
jgi:hypothetical protein